MPIKSPVHRLVYTGVLSIGFAFLWLMFPPIKLWFHLFIKLESIWFIYTVLFFSILFIFLFRFFTTFREKSFYYLVLLGFTVGHLIGVISIITAYILASNDTERIKNTINLVGVIDYFYVHFVLAIPLGGWLIGAFSVILLKIFNDLQI